MAPAPMGNYVQYISMTPVFINIRFELWDKILQQPNPMQHWCTVIFYIILVEDLHFLISSNLMKPVKNLTL